jgi:hypothetical protein
MEKRLKGKLLVGSLSTKSCAAGIPRLMAGHACSHLQWHVLDSVPLTATEKPSLHWLSKLEALNIEKKDIKCLSGETRRRESAWIA